MLETASEKERDPLYEKCLARWKSEDEVTSREMRKVLRRKMTRLSLEHLNQVCCVVLRFWCVVFCCVRNAMPRNAPQPRGRPAGSTLDWMVDVTGRCHTFTAFLSMAV